MPFHGGQTWLSSAQGPRGKALLTWVSPQGPHTAWWGGQAGARLAAGCVLTRPTTDAETQAVRKCQLIPTTQAVVAQSRGHPRLQLGVSVGRPRAG